MSVLTVIGARPQFVKAAAVSRALSDYSIAESIIHTGQHFDASMSNVFFSELKVPEPKYLLDINRMSHGEMTGQMLQRLEEIFLLEQPEQVLVYGDTNSTLAGALAAAKLGISVVHIEAGLRSFNRAMPEEVNRVVTDHISDVLFCPTDSAIANLRAEGLENERTRIIKVGDVMQDASLLFSQHARPVEGLKVPSDYVLATIHRAENTDDPNRLARIVDGLNDIHSSIAEVIIPLHPRTKNAISSASLDLQVNAIDPIGYLEMLWLLKSTRAVLTDSGGLQKEAFFFRKPCMTIRQETEWVELVDIGVNRLFDVDKIDLRMSDELQKILESTVFTHVDPYGGGQAAQRIAKILCGLNQNKS